MLVDTTWAVPRTYTNRKGA